MFLLQRLFGLILSLSLLIGTFSFVWVQYLWFYRDNVPAEVQEQLTPLDPWTIDLPGLEPANVIAVVFAVISSILSYRALPSAWRWTGNVPDKRKDWLIADYDKRLKEKTEEAGNLAATNADLWSRNEKLRSQRDKREDDLIKVESRLEKSNESHRQEMAEAQKKLTKSQNLADHFRTQYQLIQEENVKLHWFIDSKLGGMPKDEPPKFFADMKSKDEPVYEAEEVPEQKWHKETKNYKIDLDGYVYTPEGEPISHWCNPTSDQETYYFFRDGNESYMRRYDYNECDPFLKVGKLVRPYKAGDQVRVEV